MDEKTLTALTVAQLKSIAKQKNIAIGSSMRKQEIIGALLASEKQAPAAAVPEEKKEGRQPAAAGKPEGPAAKKEMPAGQAPEEKEKSDPEAEPEAFVRKRPLNTQRRMGARTAEPAPQPKQRPRANGERAAAAPGRPGGDASGRERPSRPEQPRANQERMLPERTAAVPERAPSAQEKAPAAPERSYPGPTVSELLADGNCGEGAGVLEICQDGYGFLRADNYLPGDRDAYVSAAQIRRFNLRTGDYVTGRTRATQQSGSAGLIYIDSINGRHPEEARKRRPFESLIPVFPTEKLRMESGDPNDFSLRMIDLIAPIGKGQRGMIVSPPKAGKTTILKKIANAVTRNNPEVHLIVLLIDERPEEVTDMRRSTEGEVVFSTFDEAPENHTRVSEMVLERAQRLTEMGKDVVILLDSVTRLARAYNLVIPPTGRSLSGGLDPGALYKPKRFFGAARNIENGGSLTIIATALVDTGSRMDDIIFEEFKGTGNMELRLDRSLSDRRIFPAVDLLRSGTRRDELLLTQEEAACANGIRRLLGKDSSDDQIAYIMNFLRKTKNNEEFARVFLKTYPQ